MQSEPGKAYPDLYEQQFQEKLAQLQQTFETFDLPPISAFRSPPQNFRMRAEFKVWHDKGRVHYAMYKQGEYKKPYIIEDFSIGSTTICRLMPQVLNEINACEKLKRKLFQIEFLTSTTGESLITLIYHRPLDSEWEALAKNLETKLQTYIIGRSRKQKTVLSQDFIVEKFEVGQKTYQYQQVESSFTQPNAALCEKMLGWAQEASKDCGGDLLELYCGNGNFTLPLAENFERVLATEVSKTSVTSANYNIRLNNCGNIHLLRMSSEEFCSAINEEREFRRLKEIDLKSYHFSTVFVDPPRAGLDQSTEALVAGFDNILYISCNPVTLKNNLTHLQKTHKIQAFAFFDQFPYSHHQECGVMLRRR